MRGVGKLSAFRLSPVKDFQLLFFYLNFWWIAERRRLSSITNRLTREKCFGCDLGLVFEGKEAVSNIIADTIQNKYQTPTTTSTSTSAPPHFSQSFLCLHYNCALFDQWHFKCHKQSQNIMRGGQLHRHSVWQTLQSQSVARRREEKRLCNWYLFR